MCLNIYIYLVCYLQLVSGEFVMFVIISTTSIISMKWNESTSCQKFAARDSSRFGEFVLHYFIGIAFYISGSIQITQYQIEFGTYIYIPIAHLQMRFETEIRLPFFAIMTAICSARLAVCCNANIKLSKQLHLDLKINWITVFCFTHKYTAITMLCQLFWP